MTEIHIGGGIVNLTADVPAIPIVPGTAQPVGQSPAKNRQVGKIGRMRASHRSAHRNRQQKPTHRNTPIDTLTWHRSSLVNLNQWLSRAPIAHDLLREA